MDEKLRELAGRLGIATEYTDSGLKAGNHLVDDETIRFFAGVLGYKAGNNEETERSLRALDNRRWQSVLEPVYVVEEKKKVFDAVLPVDDFEGDFGLKLVSRQTGSTEDVSFVVTVTAESRTIAKKEYRKAEIEITSALAIGYYEVELKTSSGTYKTLLAIAPEKCYLPKGWERKKLWGYCIQLYSLRSRRNWARNADSLSMPR